MKKIILITGAAGMVGSNLIRKYINQDVQIVGIDSLKLGKLKYLNHVYTNGKTPRHFCFDKTGLWIFVGNQDSNNLSIFSFCPDSGIIKLHNTISINSPNFLNSI